MPIDSDVLIDSPPATVWAVLTDASLAPSWTGGAQVTSDWRPGSPVEVSGGGVRARGSVTAADAPRALVVGVDHPGGHHDVRVDLSEETAAATRLRASVDGPVIAGAPAQEVLDAVLASIKDCVERTAMEQ